MSMLFQMKVVPTMSRVRRLAEALRNSAALLRSEAETQGGSFREAYNYICDVLDNLKAKLDQESPEFDDTWNPKL